jgi:hypothetical protein
MPPFDQILKKSSSGNAKCGSNKFVYVFIAVVVLSV